MVQQERCQVPTSGPAGNNDRTRNAVFHAPRNVSGQHEKEIDSLCSAAGSPTCYRYQPDDQEDSHSAHYVGTVLLCCEQLGLLSFLLNRITPQWRSYGVLGTR